MEQMSLFDGSKKFIVDKPIRLISLFSGYDSQEFALKYLGVNYEHWKTCEWAVKSIQALKDAHYENDNTDYSADHSQEFIIHQLFKWGISANYNEPMTKEQIKRLGEQKQRQIYNNIKATHNLVNIQQVSADRLEIIDRDKYCYLMTYSFPCQDLSKAGKGKGMAKDSGTRSGMLWEVERILDECNGNLPQILLMENVPDVIGSKNIEHFAKWLEKLESLGYKCYWRILNAKDYGVPQNHERCFMISILGDYYYEFPQPIKLEHKLKDLLEDNVDEKYYLSDKMVKYIASNNEKWTGNNDNSIINRDIAVTINTRVGNTRADCSDYLCKELPQNYNLKTKLCNKLIASGKVNENDVIRHNYTISKNGDCVQANNMCPTLDTRCDCLGVVVNKRDKFKNFQKFGSYYTWENKKGELNTQCNRAANIENCALTVACGSSGNIYTNYRIRKLTPKECFRLMGVKDKDFEKMAQNQSNASLYHLAGDSIVVNVLMAIFGKLFDKEE